MGIELQCSLYEIGIFKLEERSSLCFGSTFCQQQKGLNHSETFALGLNNRLLNNRILFWCKCVGRYMPIFTRKPKESCVAKTAKIS